MLDLDAALRQLYAEKARLDAVIDQLSLLQASAMYPPPPAGRRGRKSMSPEERQVVSKRMRDYWEQRRQQKCA
jgi:hypothetical protein